MIPGEFSPSFDAKHRVLRLTTSIHVTVETYESAIETIRRFIAAHGQCSVIFDLSLVEKFDVSTTFARRIAESRPVIEPPMQRVVVATTPVVFGTVRIIETLRSDTPAPITIVKTIDEAYAIFDASASDFVPVDP